MKSAVNKENKYNKLYIAFSLASLTIGILIIMATLGLAYMDMLADLGSQWAHHENRDILFSVIAIVINSISLIWGLLGLKANKRKIAIAAIIVCLIDFIPLIRIQVFYHSL